MSAPRASGVPDAEVNEVQLSDERLRCPHEEGGDVEGDGEHGEEEGQRQLLAAQLGREPRKNQSVLCDQVAFGHAELQAHAVLRLENRQIEAAPLGGRLFCDGHHVGILVECGC